MASLPIAVTSTSSSTPQFTNQTASTDEPTQPGISAATSVVDAAPAGWSMRGIFSTVLSKLPYGGGGASSADSSAVRAATKDTDTSMGEDEETHETEQMEEGAAASSSGTTQFTTRAPASNQSTDSSSPSSLPVPSDGSINLAEAHLPVPWLTDVDTDTRLAPSVQRKRAEPRALNVNGSQTLSSPLSAPLPSMPAPTTAASASSPSSSFSSDGTTSFSFALPSQARASNAVDRSLLQLDRDKVSQPAKSLLPIAVDPLARSDEAETATTFSASSASQPSSTASSPTSVLTTSLSVQASPLTSADQSTLRLSLCGSYLGSSASLNQQLFDQHAVSFETLSLQPELTFRSDLVILYQSKLYPSRVALPLILSTLAFSRPLAITQAALDRLNTMALPHLPTSSADGEDAGAFKSTDSKVESAIVHSPESGGRSWRDWFRSKKPPPIDTVTDGSRTVLAVTQAAATALEPQPEEDKQSTMRQSKSMEDLSTLTDDNNNNAGTSITVQSPNLTSKRALLPSLDPLLAPSAPSSAAGSPRAARPLSKPSFIKSLRPTSDMLRSLNLQPGRNLVSFSVSSALQGEQTVKASIFLWRPDVKIVISDIDGTITRSDILGHVMPLVGRDWSHFGVTKLYTDIRRNGYELLYLTSRAIGQANITRGYISSLRQGESSLPLGPVIMSPDRLLHSFKREVIDRRPQGDTPCDTRHAQAVTR